MNNDLLVEAVADALAASNGLNMVDLSLAVREPQSVIRDILKQLQALGIVRRTGASRASRWHLV